MSNLCLIEGSEVDIGDGSLLELYYCDKLVSSLMSVLGRVVVPNLPLPYYEYVIRNTGEITSYGTAFIQRTITK